MKKLILIIFSLFSFTALANNYECQLIEKDIKDSGWRYPEKVDIDLNIQKTKSSDEYISINNQAVYLDSSLANIQVIPVIEKWNSKKIKTDDSDEIVSFQYELDLKSNTLTYKIKAANTFFGPKKLMVETTYQCVKI